MGDIKHGTQLMLQFMGGEVFGSATLHQVIVRQAASPHNLCAVTIVGGTNHHLQRTVFHRLHQSLGQRIGQRHVLMDGEITLHRMHHDVGGSGSGLIRR